MYDWEEEREKREIRERDRRMGYAVSECDFSFDVVVVPKNARLPFLASTITDLERKKKKDN